MSNIDPTGQEIQQYETPEYQAVRVQVETPVKAQPMPAPIGFSFTKVVRATDLGVKLLPRDPRRGRTNIVSIDQPFYYGNTEAEAEQGVGAVWPDLVALVITHTDEVWVACAAAGSLSTIGVVSELWAH
jgi:hypothetical protein